MKNTDDDWLCYLSKRTWSDKEITLERKLEILDELFELGRVPLEVRKEYRKLRFLLDKNTVCYLLKDK